jgi:hypothetical protein
MIVDQATREPAGRPWITLAIDVLTRMVAGFHLALESPSLTSVGLCLLHAVYDKTVWLAERHVDTPGRSPVSPRRCMSTTAPSSAAEPSSEPAAITACRSGGVPSAHRISAVALSLEGVWFTFDDPRSHGGDASGLGPRPYIARLSIFSRLIMHPPRRLARRRTAAGLEIRLKSCRADPNSARRRFGSIFMLNPHWYRASMTVSSPLDPTRDGNREDQAFDEAREAVCRT